MIASNVRPAAPGDLRALAAFVARLNAPPASRSLHCAAESPAGVRAALQEHETFPDGWERAFVLAEAGGEIVSVCGCQLDADGAQGWLWGPWIDEPPGWAFCAPALLEALLARLPRTMLRVEAFLHAENRDGLRFLQSRGFSLGALTHIYVAPRAVPLPDTIEPLPRLRAAHEVAFARLHTETFPAGGSTPADVLLAGRNDEHAVFAATDGLRLLGYVCVSTNRAPREGFIEYLAVRPNARGQGIGARLLQTALRWTFEERRLPQAALCVTEWRGGARRLYENAGFRLHASGIAARGAVGRAWTLRGLH